MTVEQFYEQKYGSGEVGAGGGGQGGGGMEGQKKEEEEEEEEEETEESLKKARESDDFKDGELCSEMFVYWSSWF